MIAAAPTAMKMPRKNSARMMPTSNAVCWYFLGTWNLAMMIRKMNRLSTLRLYSVSQPAKNSPAYWPPEKTQTPSPKTTARRDVERDRAGRFLGGGFVRPAADDEDVEGQQGEQHSDGDVPDVVMNVHRQTSGAQTNVGLRRSLPPGSISRARPAAPGAETNS